MLCLAHLLYSCISEEGDLGESEMSIVQIQVNYQTQKFIWWLLFLNTESSF